MLELLNHIKNVLVLSGLEGARLDSAMFLIEDKLESTIVLSSTVEVKEPEKVVEIKEIIKEVEKEVVPTAVQEELDSFKNKNEELESKIQELEEVNDDLNCQIKELESDLNDTMNILEATLDEKDQLEARCTELHEQNEYLLSQLEEPEEEVTFEEPEEVSNEDILANSMNEEVDEEAILNQLEKSLEQVAIEEPEEVSNEDILANSMNEEVDEEAILNQLEKSLEQVAIEEPEKKVNRGSRTSKRKANSTYDMYGNPRKKRSLRQNDDDTHVFLNYYRQIKSGELNQNNLTLELITKIHTLACKVNKGNAPREVAELYFNIMNGDE